MKYQCNWCFNVVEVKAVERRQIGDRMASGLYGYCPRCKKEHLMLEITNV